MTHCLLTRAHLEAVLIARAVVHHELAPYIVEQIDRDRLSVAGWALLAQLAQPTAADDGVRPGSAAQLRLLDRVDLVTVADLCFWPLDTLIALVNQLPERPTRVASWERDLAAGLVST